jgi:hypothetical protein
LELGADLAVNFREVDPRLLEESAGEDPGPPSTAAGPLPEVLAEPAPIGALERSGDPVLEIPEMLPGPGPETFGDGAHGPAPPAGGLFSYLL